jgi:biotin carboxyl carrier protein
VVVLDGERKEVEVDLARETVRIGTHEWPIQLETSGNGSVTFEILGERVQVRRDISADGSPGGSVVVNGELHSLTVESSAGSTRRLATTRAGVIGAASAPAAGGAAVEGPGWAVLPPMPGKVLEVRVRNGEKVESGQVLLVVEAMKMRNEVTAPVAGEVSGLQVVAGANVGARDVLLRILVA